MRGVGSRWGNPGLFLLAGALALAWAGAAAAADPNPCTARTLNPCTAKANPCNPCGAKANPCNPCGAKGNPCNPCGAKANPCNPCNPCGAGGSVDPARFKQPAGAKLATGRHSKLVERGEELWNDRGLGSSGLACGTCHFGKYAQMKDTFDEPYPHYVNMPAQQAGVKEVNAAEMVNFCMLVPMQAEPLPWESRDLAALAAYVERIQTGFEPGAGGVSSSNPCNPCGAKANPCNPCGAKANPCNPCGAKANPCNPCAR